MPRNALQTIKGNKAVFVSEGSGFKMRPEPSGARTSENVEILKVSSLANPSPSGTPSSSRPNSARPKPSINTESTEHRHDQRILDFSIHHRWLVVLLVVGARGVRRAVAAAAADRRGARHHQQPGADQHRRAGAVARSRSRSRSPSDRDRAGRHPGPRIHALALAQRLLAGDGGLRRRRPTSISPASRSTSGCSKPKQTCPAGAEPKMGPISTGLGEIYMWTVEYSIPAARARRSRTGKPGWQSDGSYLTPGGRAAARPTSSGRLSAHGAGLDHPARSSRACRALPASTRSAATSSSTRSSPIPLKLIALGLSFADVIKALERNNSEPRRRLHRAQRRRLRGARDRRGSRAPQEIGNVVRRHQATACRSVVHDVAEVGIGARAAHRQRQRERPGGRRRHGADADRRQQPHRRRRRR